VSHPSIFATTSPVSCLLCSPQFSRAMRYVKFMSLVALATSDGVSVCDHLARSAAFVVVEIVDGREVGRKLRTRGTEACGNHASFVQMLNGCDAVICGGIGQGAAVSLAANGVESLVAPTFAGAPIADALRAWIEGRLATSDERVCLCSH
jgi:predicted Fe-Mo cluster-binding NifX family protein